jgi:hypothetical protein
MLFHHSPSNPDTLCSSTNWLVFSCAWRTLSGGVCSRSQASRRACMLAEDARPCSSYLLLISVAGWQFSECALHCGQSLDPERALLAALSPRCPLYDRASATSVGIASDVRFCSPLSCASGALLVASAGRPSALSLAPRQPPASIPTVLHCARRARVLRTSSAPRCDGPALLRETQLSPAAHRRRCALRRQ